MRQWAILLCMGIVLISIFSCNATVEIALFAPKADASTASQAFLNKEMRPLANINVDVDIPKYFVKYLSDLFGEEGIENILDRMRIKEYLSYKEAVTLVNVEGIEGIGETDKIKINIQSDDLIASLDDMDIDYIIRKKDGYEDLSIEVTRDFLRSFFENFDEIRQLDIINIFLPDPKIVPRDEFPDYISWSFSDYYDVNLIQKNLNESKITFNLIRGKEIYDASYSKEWKLNKNGVLESEFLFIPVVYSARDASEEEKNKIHIYY